MKILIVAVVCVALIVIASLILLNKTFGDLKMGDTVIGETSVKDTPLNDMKLITFSKTVSALSKEGTGFVTSKAPATADKDSAATALIAAGLPFVNQRPSYEDLLSGEMKSADRKLLVLSGKQLAAVMNDAVTNSTELTGAMAEIQSMGVKVEALTISGNSAEIIFSVEPKLTDKKYLQRYIPVKFYVTCVLKLTLGADGKISSSPEKVLLNNLDDENTMKLFETVLKATGADFNTSESFCGSAGDMLCEMLNNIGEIGTATADGSGNLTGINIGDADAIKDGKISFITRKITAAQG